MKQWICVAIIFAAPLILTSCATSSHLPTQVASNYIQQQDIVALGKESYPAKNPQQVALYGNNQSPHTGYRVIGQASVAKHNLFGIARQKETIDTMLKSLAASIGGDGLINVKKIGDNTEASVIAYERIIF
jgi:hypothetical protein